MNGGDSQTDRHALRRRRAPRTAITLVCLIALATTSLLATPRRAAAQEDPCEPGVSCAALDVTMESNNVQPEVGEEMRFTITITNSGPGDATGIQTLYALDTNDETFVGASDSGTLDSSGNVLWPVFDLSVNSTETRTVTVRNESTRQRTSFGIVCCWSPKDPEIDVNTTNATVTITPVQPAQADLSLSKAVDNDAPNVGEEVKFTVTVANAGPGAATGVEVLESLPPTMTFVRSTASQGTYDPNDTDLWAIGDLPANSTAELTITMEVGSEPGTNHAQISNWSGGDAGGQGDNSAEVSVTPVLPATSTTTTTTEVTTTTTTTTTTTAEPTTTTSTTEPTTTTSTTEATTTTSTTGPAPAPPSVWLELASIEPGQTQTGHATGFEPGEIVTAEQQSTPLSLGSQVADANGAVTFTRTIRADETVGEHRLYVSGELSGQASATFAVAAPAPAAELPATGIDLDTMLLVSAAIVAYGLAIVVATSRWRTLTRR